MISVIIPAYNEEKALPVTLTRLFEQAGRFEVILVDGASTDRTREIAGVYPGVEVLTAPKGRASQMNVGAARASGDWLLFLHADTLLPADALKAIEALDSTIKAGGFHHRFSGRGVGLRLISILHNFRCRVTRVFYGDQAMFVRRRLFHQLGKFPEQPTLEDIAFCEKLTAATTPVFLQEVVTTDSRKFVQNGVWRSLARVLLIVVCVQLRLSLPSGTLKFFQDVR